MKVRSWLATQNPTISSTKQLFTDSDSVPPAADATTSASSPSSSSSINLQSNHSLQTVLSVPSLQNLTPQLLTLSFSSHSTTSLNSSPSLQITCLAIHHNLLYAASGHIINVYNRTTCHHLHAFNANQSSSGSVKSITFCNGRIFTAHQDCKIRVWKLSHNKEHKLVTVLPTIDELLYRSILPMNYVKVRRHKKMLWIQHADAVTSLAVNNGLIYSVSWDKYLKIWSASRLRCLQSVKAHEDAINAVVISAAGTVYTGSADCKIRVWGKPVDGKKYSLVATLEKHKSAVNALALNDDGSGLFSGACDRSILVWERDDGANHMVLSGALRGHGKAILSLINVSDLLLSGSADRTVRIWQRGHDGKYCCLAVLEGHNKPIKSLAAVWEEGNNNKNGVVSVYSGSLNGEIKTWKVSVFRPSSPVSPYQVLQS